ncbi:hypothetical protein M5K25_007541 [Dendrobium thyrsiflorum]|uniref:Uncharacterized protein n=1 Tax=Dendrobium thyrsiflorum TaxID=117978 RepID=A0ABD0VLT6_DENTH
MSFGFKRSDPSFLAGKIRSKYFKEVLAISDVSLDFPYLRVTTLMDLPALWVSKEEVMYLVKLFDYVLVGKFLLRRLVLDVIRKFFFNLKLSIEFSVTLLDQKNVLIKLANDLDYGEDENISDLNLHVNGSPVGLDGLQDVGDVNGKDLALMVNSSVNLNASSVLNFSNVVQEGCEGLVNDVEEAISQSAASPSLVVDNVGVCDVNRIEVLDSPCDFVSRPGGYDVVESFVPPFKVNDANMPILDVPISLISKDDLFAQLDLTAKGTGIDHSDWLEGYIYSPGSDDGYELVDPIDEMYGLDARRVVPKALSRDGG